MRSLALLLLLLAAPAAAQCPGDCDGDGAVLINELVLGVRIALGEPLALCQAFDVTPDGTVRIEELVQATNAALGGCAMTPTVPPATATADPSGTPDATATPDPPATPTASAAATATGGETPTATPTVPPVAGTWREAPLTIRDSTCLEIFTAFLAEQFTARGACDQVVEQTGPASVRVTDCSAQVVDGTLAPDGTISLTFPPAVVVEEDCEVTLDVTSTIPAAANPTTARYVFALAFGGACDALEACTVEAEGEWRRPETARN